MALPPIHRSDHVPIFIPAIDSAWDTELIDYEYSVIAGADPDEDRPVLYTSMDDHPVYRYRTGTARCDLATVESYLDKGKAPVMFRLRRLTFRQVRNLRGILESSTGSAGVLFAIKHGLEDTGNLGLKFTRRGTEGGPLSEKDAENLRNMVGDDIFEEIGHQVISVSRKVLDLEKKP